MSLRALQGFHPHHPQSYVGAGRHRMKGRGFMDFMGKVGGFLKKTKLLSRVGGLASLAFPALRGPAAVAGMFGYGRRHHRRYRRHCRSCR